MKKLNSSEIYSKTYGADNEIKIAISNQLRDDIGVISPEHIQNALLTLKTCKAGSYYPFLSDALALYETRGLIRLFNLSNANGGRSKIPTTLPYFVAAGRNRAKDRF